MIQILSRYTEALQGQKPEQTRTPPWLECAPISAPKSACQRGDLFVSPFYVTYLFDKAAVSSDAKLAFAVLGREC